MAPTFDYGAQIVQNLGYLGRVADAILNLLKPRQCIIDSFTLTVPATPQPLFKDRAAMNMGLLKLEVHERSKGTSTYVAFGDKNGQAWRMDDANLYYWQLKIPEGYYLKAGDLFVDSDTADAVIEVMATVAK